MIEAGILNTMALRMADQLNSRHGLLFLLDQSVDAESLKTRMRTDDHATLLDHLYSISPACIDVLKSTSASKPNVLLGLTQSGVSYIIGKAFIAPSVGVSRRDGTDWIADTLSNMLVYKPDYATLIVNLNSAVLASGAHQRTISFSASHISGGLADKFSLKDKTFINNTCNLDNNISTRHISNSTYTNKRDIVIYLHEIGYIEDRTVNTITVRFGYPASTTYKPKWSSLRFGLYAFDEVTSTWINLVFESNLVEGFLTFNFDAVTAKRFRFSLEGNFGAADVNQAEIYITNIILGTTEHSHVPQTYNIDKALFLPNTFQVPTSYTLYFPKPKSVPSVLMDVSETSGIQFDSGLIDGNKFSLVAPAIPMSEMYLSEGMKHLMLSVITNAFTSSNALIIIAVHLFEGPVPTKSELDNLYFDNVSNYTVTNAHTKLNTGSRKLLGSVSASVSVDKLGISSIRTNQRCFHFNTDMNIKASGTASFALITLDRIANVSASLMIASISTSDADIIIKDVNVVAGSSVSLGDISIDYFEESV